MSIKKHQLIFLTVALVSFGIYQFMRNSSRTSARNFVPQFNISQYSSRGAVDRIISLKIETRTLSKISDSTRTEVIAFVSLPFDLNESVQYKWTLGQNVFLLEGALEGTSDKGFRKDIPRKIRLVVKGFTPDQLRHIGFEVWVQSHGRPLFAEGLISSQKENSFEDVVQHVEKIKAEKTGIHK